VHKKPVKIGMVCGPARSVSEKMQFCLPELERENRLHVLALAKNAVANALGEPEVCV
jgi:hypothetical protein